MAAVPWKPLFWERFGDSFTFAGAARDCLAAVAQDLASPLRGGEEDRALVRIDKCDRKLAEAAKFLAFTVSGLGTVEVLALRCLRSDDVEEIRARPRARAARERASNAYDALASSRGHLGAAERLFAATAIANDAVEEERVDVLAAIEAALEALDAMQESRTSDASVPDVVLPRVQSRTRSAAETPNLVGGSSAAAWISLGKYTPGSLVRVALNGAVAELEAAHAALRVIADAIDKDSKLTAAALGLSAAAADWSDNYHKSFLALGAAHAALSTLLAVKGESDLVFLRCAPQLGLNRGGPGWICWEAARADAERHGRAALDHLWSASSFVDYCLAGVLAWGSAGQEARELMLRALANAGQARVAADRLPHAAGRAFYHARKVLQGARCSEAAPTPSPKANHQ
uniref:Uncharacterized protein n=1 Tax=Avena sativa TaxID=4498 RepID=A0ACD5VC98_AVESA